MPALPRPKHEQFAQALSEGCSQIEAARKAGYSDNRSYASTLAQEPDISKRVAELRARKDRQEEKAIARAAERLMLTKERVLKSLMNIAFADLRKVARWNDNGMLILPSDMIPDGEALAIAEVSVDRSGKPKIKLADRLQALTLLGRHLAMFREHVEVTGNLAKDVDADGSNVREILLGRLASIAARSEANDNDGRADGRAISADGAGDVGANPTAAPGVTEGFSWRGVAGELGTGS